MRFVAGAVLALAALGAGCGGGAMVSQGGVDKFIGDWKFDSETLMADCVSQSVDLTGKILTLAVIAGNQISAMLPGICVINFNVAGTTATAPAGQTCSLPLGAIMVPVSLSSWTLTTTDGVSMSTAQKGTAEMGICNVTGSGMLTKQP